MTTTTMAELVPVAIPGSEIPLLAALIDDRPFVPVRPVCDALKLSFQRQYRKLDQAEWATVARRATVGADGKQREMLALDADHLPMWLATIQASRVKPEARPTLVAYQREAAKALRDYFMPGRAERRDGVVIEASAIQRAEALISVLSQSSGLVGKRWLSEKTRFVLDQLIPTPHKPVNRKRASATVVKPVAVVNPVVDAAPIPAARPVPSLHGRPVSLTHFLVGQLRREPTRRETMSMARKARMRYEEVYGVPPSQRVNTAGSFTNNYFPSDIDLVLKPAFADSVAGKAGA